MIKAANLIQKFKQAQSEKWGYIWGTAGGTWTAEKQRDAEQEYARAVSQQNQKGIDRWEMTAKHGSKWIGSRVADCSGLFVWAYKQYNVYLPHGSNSIWKSYLQSKGELNNGKRTDGKELRPGTAVFRKNGTDYYHIGLYIGNGQTIEAQGTTTGVVISKISRWHAWGELKHVQYDEEVSKVSETYKTAYVAVDGGVNFRTKASVGAEKIGVLPKGKQIQAYDIGNGWCKVL